MSGREADLSDKRGVPGFPMKPVEREPKPALFGIIAATIGFIAESGSSGLVVGVSTTAVVEWAVVWVLITHVAS